MQWDLGPVGIATLVSMALVFGLVAQLALQSDTTRWVGLIAAAAFAVGALFTSEVWFGWATEADLQPNINGLSFDEALMGGLVAGALAMLVTWLATREGRSEPVGGERGVPSSRRPHAGHR